MSELLREIDEDLRKERMMKTAKRVGPWVVGAALLVVATVGGWQAWESYQDGQRDARSEAFAAALGEMRAGNDEAALAAFSDLAATDGSDYAILASFEAARLKAEAGDLEGAIADWRALAAAPDAPEGLRASATIFSVMHRMGADGADAQALQGELEPLTAEGEPMRATALELQAVLAETAGDRERAAELYARVSDDLGAPGSARQRATQLLGVLEE